MRDTDVINAFWTVFKECMNEYGIEDVPFLKLRQTSKVGRADVALYYDTGAPQNVGWQSRKYSITKDSENAGHREIAAKQIEVRIYALVDESKSNGLTANELADTARMVIASLPFIERIREKGIGGVGRATEPTDTTIINDEDDFEREVQFKFPLTYTKSLFPNTGVIRKMNGPTIKRV